MQSKTTRAFRTISEAGEELELQPHVLRFWESKFSDIKPIKRGGGRRFYRPEDIEFLRGIKTLLHDEKHPIKDVQKLIKKRGPGRITELGRSVEQAARERPVAETQLLPERIRAQPAPRRAAAPQPIAVAPEPAPVVVPQPAPVPQPALQPAPVAVAPAPAPLAEKPELQDALARLKALKADWGAFRADSD
jgi:DNA-binding transcriptional MerR regulator